MSEWSERSSKRASPTCSSSVAELAHDLDVVGQLEVAGGGALGERRAGHDGGGAQADDERARGRAEAAATARITRAVPATCAAAAALPPSPGIT